MQPSYWEKTSFFCHQNIVIAGAGLLGMWTALELKRLNPSLKITILERNCIPCGASTRNAGFACFGSPSELLEDISNNGVDSMLSVFEKRFTGIAKTRSMFGDAADYEACGGFEVYDANSNVLAEVKEKLHWLNELVKPVTRCDQTFVWCREKLQGFGLNGFETMVENALEGSIHSGKLVRAMMIKCFAEGIQMLFSTPVTKWEVAANGLKVYSTGFGLNCDKLIIAANGFTSSLCQQAEIQPARGQIIVTSEIPGLKLRGTFHYQEGYYYFRNLGNRVLMGGARNLNLESEATNSLDVSDEIQRELERFVKLHILPTAEYEIEHRWSGIMGFTPDKMPTIKQVDRGVLALGACNGMGVALTPIVAVEAAALANEL